MAEHIETAIVGGGQAGLSLSYYLTQLGREHVVIESRRVGESWRSARWDSFTLVTPNQLCRLPGFSSAGPDPDGFIVRDEVVAYLDRYAAFFGAPLRCGVRVEAVAPAERQGYQVRTSAGEIEADNVVVATGFFHRPTRPALSAELPTDIVQTDVSSYRNPDALPPGATLVVGSGQSGAQIAEELYQAGRRVYLCVSSAGRVPRRYRGHDIAWWYDTNGTWDRTVDQLPSPKARLAPNPHVSGKGKRGRTLNLHRFARDGVVLLGHLRGAQGARIQLEPDLYQNLVKADAFAATARQGIDAYVQRIGMDAPLQPEDLEPEPRDGFATPIIPELELREAGISSVVWAVGFASDYRWVHLPVVDEYGFPLQKRGVTTYPGLYFLGMPWLHTQKSGVLAGVGQDAMYLAGCIAPQA